MSTVNKPALPTAAEVCAQIDQAEQEVVAACAALGEALFIKAAVPDRDVGPEQAAVDAARQRIGQLNAMLPIVENAERAAHDETRAKLAAEHRRHMAKELKDLVRA